MPAITPSGSDDLETLVGEVAAGSQKSLGRLYELTSAKLLGVAVRILRRQDWAEEIVHDAYVRVWNHAASYAPERGAAMTWLVSIVRNASLDRLRRHSRETPLDDVADLENWADDKAGPLDNAMNSESGRALLACLRELGETQRICMMLAYCEGYTQEELAVKLDRPLGTIKSWVRRGLAQLKGCLGR